MASPLKTIEQKARSSCPFPTDGGVTTNALREIYQNNIAARLSHSMERPIPQLSQRALAVVTLEILARELGEPNIVVTRYGWRPNGKLVCVLEPTPGKEIPTIGTQLFYPKGAGANCEFEHVRISKHGDISGVCRPEKGEPFLFLNKRRLNITDPSSPDPETLLPLANNKVLRLVVDGSQRYQLMIGGKLITEIDNQPISSVRSAGVTSNGISFGIATFKEGITKPFIDFQVTDRIWRKQIRETYSISCSEHTSPTICFKAEDGCNYLSYGDELRNIREYVVEPVESDGRNTVGIYRSNNNSSPFYNGKVVSELSGRTIVETDQVHLSCSGEPFGIVSLRFGLRGHVVTLPFFGNQVIDHLEMPIGMGNTKDIFITDCSEIYESPDGQLAIKFTDSNDSNWLYNRGMFTKL